MCETKTCPVCHTEWVKNPCSNLYCTYKKNTGKEMCPNCFNNRYSR